MVDDSETVVKMTMMKIEKIYDIQKCYIGLIYMKTEICDYYTIYSINT